MPSNPNVQAAFSGTTPDVEVAVNTGGRTVSMSSNRSTRDVSFSVERGGNMYNIYIKTTAEWNQMASFIPNRGDVCIYSDHGTITDEFGNEINVPGIKIGDGSAYLIDQPFVGDDVRYQILTELRMHTGNTEIHVTAEEKEFWGNKLNCLVSDGNLILNRL